MTLDSKKCTKCGETKPKSEFRLKSGKWLDSWCNDCNNKDRAKHRKTIDGFLCQSYQNKITNSKRRGHHLPVFSKEEYVLSAKNSHEFMRIWHDYVKSGYTKSLSPSFDRKNDELGYSWDNFNKWMTWDENDKKWNTQVRNGETDVKAHPMRVVFQYSINGELVSEFHSMMDASRKTKIHQSAISMCCSGKRGTAGGFIWKHKN